MASGWEKKTVVVTGASSGIGRAAAMEFARRGANLVVAARRQELLDEVATACRAFGVDCRTAVTDVMSRSDCEHLIEVAGQVDVLVNNAGFAIFDLFESAKPEDLESMMMTNYFGAVWCAHAVLPQMLARRSGTIVNVAS
ncbi:MAG: SDR family NAD(P)-dependent oxidoreductase, partial [Thermoanaerobaculia bacterium]